MYQYRLNFTAAQRNASAGAWLTGRLFPWRLAVPRIFAGEYSPVYSPRIFARIFASNIREYTSRIFAANIRQKCEVYLMKTKTRDAPNPSTCMFLISRNLLKC